MKLKNCTEDKELDRANEKFDVIIKSEYGELVIEGVIAIWNNAFDDESQPLDPHIELPDGIHLSNKNKFDVDCKAILNEPAISVAEAEIDEELPFQIYV